MLEPLWKYIKEQDPDGCKQTVPSEEHIQGPINGAGFKRVLNSEQQKKEPRYEVFGFR